MEEVGSIPSVKVVLLGPSGSGKTTFLITLLEGKPPLENKPTERTYIKETIRQYFKFSNGRYIPAEQYKLIVADTPGAMDKVSERKRGIEKSIIGIFFYDLTSPRSLRELELILNKEIIETEAYYNLMGIVVIGCKKDKGFNTEALTIASKIVGDLTQLVQDLWGYKVPHLAINCREREDVHKAFYVAESLVMDKAPLPIIEHLSAEKLTAAPTTRAETITPEIPKQPSVVKQPVVEKKVETPKTAPQQPVVEAPKVEKKEAPAKSVPPHLKGVTGSPVQTSLPREEVTERREIGVELNARARALETAYRIRPHESEKIWATVAKLHQSKINEIEEIFFIKKAGEVLFIAYSPRNKGIHEINIDSLAKAIQFELVADELSSDYNVGFPKYYVISSSSKSLLIVKRKNALLIIKTRGKPSEDLINLLV